ncbi:cobalamin biosynthesis protein CbiX [Actinomadura sp. 7K507]|uniref:cobalamin biosynthesis protein CbiX n=1 Tax=Actinomadura sp. 7K507 TaxID=2530365 RepID=UPI001044435B|nr:cobalamin biosynthesis protein CbiX [Actinomadura sp. 7K507]TDC84617.1 cobalamin biosynthesis protein CbiX [Actinomadura sp. 7K507]
MTGSPGRAVLPVGGHESIAAGAAPVTMPGAGEIRGPGNGLRAALADRRRAVVVPMTLGRDPDLAPASAQTLAWAARDRPRGDLLLAAPLGTVTHLVGWIRAAVMRAARTGDGAYPDSGSTTGSTTGAVLLVAPAAGPDADAELFKVARLVWHYLPVHRVEVALDGGEPGAAEGVERCHRLGAREVTLVPASFVPPPACPGAVSAGPLLRPAAISALIRERVAEAERRWERDGDDGLAVATRHGHSHSHSHSHDAGNGHQHHHHAFPENTETTLEGAAAHGG